MNYAIAAALLLFFCLLTLVSYADRVYTEIGRFLSREFQENIATFEQRVEPKLGVSRARAALSMAVLTQIMTAAIALLVGFAVFKERGWGIYEILQATLSLVLIIILFNRFLPFVFFSRTRGEWLVSCGWILRILIYIALPVTLVLGFLQSVTALTKEHSDETPETHTEAVDALIEAGQEEGILDESNRDLIQSVVELLRTRPFSRVPVYEGSIHNIVGIVFAQDVLQVPDTEAHYRTVDTIMRRDVDFVPESKLVSDLLREMQQNNIRMAIVVDEYGGVAGLVTIEDLVEEIVGEIRDEHEKLEVIRENENSYIVPGNMDVDRLVEMFGIRPEGKESATVAGLVSELAGRIPHRGEVVEEEGLRFEVLDATERRVERVRISVAKPTQQMKLI
jgi:CBS domain containing-hemolysin-like protein